MKSRQLKKLAVGIIVLIIGLIVIKIMVIGKYVERVAEVDSEKSCAVYYLLNIDGMKGLGHSSFMIVDEQGNGSFYSYNGMQYSLTESLVGKAGVGKMKVFELDSEVMNSFLKTGDLEVSDVSECDNFDRALYKLISVEEYETIKKETDIFIEAGNEFEQLYSDVHTLTDEEQEQAQMKLQEFVQREDIPKYQIYNHNCDTVARECIATVDEVVEIYNEVEEKLTPSMNYKGMWKHLGTDWGAVHMGKDSLWEKFLWYLF